MSDETTTEKRRVDLPALILLGHDLLVALGEDPTEERFADTPTRWAKAWRDFIEYDAGKVNTAFTSTSTDQVVVVSDMKVWSMCEHHLLPFWTNIAIGYKPASKLLGLSKFGRISEACAHRLQVQERLVIDIADEVQKYTETEDIAVLAQGEHLCMTMRGVEMPSKMTSSVMRGIFREEASARMEFLKIVKG